MPTETPSAPQGASPSGRERRQHPRAPLEWPVKIALAEGLFEARLRDVSASGLCFFLDRPVSEMTVLELEFELPVTDRDGPTLACRGAVVRCERISPAVEHYEIAVFFHEMDADTRKSIERYVARG